MVLTIALSPMMSSAAADSYCLACGEPATLRNRRILCSEASSNVRTTWELLLDERLKLRGAQIDVAYLLGNEQSPNPGCMCKKCFMSVKAFSERKNQLLQKLDSAIARMPRIEPRIPHQSDHIEEQQQETPSRLHSRKRTLPSSREQHCTKRLRLSQPALDSQSPGVQVS